MDKVRDARNADHGPGDPEASHGPPGLPCPACGLRFPVSIEALLSDLPIACPACGLALSVHREKSEESLDALRRVREAIQDAEAARAAAMPGSQGRSSTRRRRRSRDPQEG
jgi:predicted  nucleic acid-binding Zn-ribbon protein